MLKKGEVSPIPQESSLETKSFTWH